MASRLPGLIAWALLLSAGQSAQAAQVGPTTAGSQVLTGAALRRAGATRLSEVLSIAHRWEVQTVDGATWNASPLGGSPFLPARWIVVVDGQRVDDDLFGVTNLDRLGVPLEQVAEVELIEIPRLIAGAITTDGIIRVTTAVPSEGPTVGGSLVTGSEIGDPGPFAFTPSATPNVDRLGHSAWAQASFGADGWFAAAALGWGTGVPTDPAIADRYTASLGFGPRLYFTAPSLRVGGRVAGGQHRGVVRHTQVDGALALNPFGTEIATDERFTLAGVAGDVPLADGRQLVYDVSHSRNRVRLAQGRPGPPVDWLAASTELRAEMARPGSTVELVGVRLRRRTVTAPLQLTDPTLGLVTAYAGLRLGHSTVGGTITVGEGEVGATALLTRRWKAGSRATLDAMLSYEHVPKAEDNTLWAWTERGYDLLEVSGAEFEIAGAPGSPRRLGADLNLSIGVDRGLGLGVRGLFRSSRDLSLERRDLHFVPAIASFEGPAALVPGVGGELAGGGLEVVSHPARDLRLRASWWVRAVLGGDDVFREAWATVPGHGARVTTEYSPVEGFDLWLAGAYRGAARHREFTAVEVESAGRYRARVADAVSVDVGAQKQLWDGRLRVHFGVRNLLGAELRYHPAGADFGPTAILQAEANLP